MLASCCLSPFFCIREDKNGEGGSLRSRCFRRYSCCRLVDEAVDESSLTESVLVVLAGDEDVLVAIVPGKSTSSTRDRDRSVFIDADIMVEEKVTQGYLLSSKVTQKEVSLGFTCLVFGKLRSYWTAIEAIHVSLPSSDSQHPQKQI